jgi:predicted metal-dependent hydrolase
MGNGHYPQLFVDFLYYFNVERDYYECHEVLEELWLEEGRERFYQGLLQVAVALHHARNDNRGGAEKLFRGALNKLEDTKDAVRMGIDVEQVKAETRARLELLFIHGTGAVTPFDIRIVDPVLKRLVEERNRGGNKPRETGKE